MAKILKLMAVMAENIFIDQQNCLKFVTSFCRYGGIFSSTYSAGDHGFTLTSTGFFEVHIKRHSTRRSRIYGYWVIVLFTRIVSAYKATRDADIPRML